MKSFPTLTVTPHGEAATDAHARQDVDRHGENARIDAQTALKDAGGKKMNPSRQVVGATE